MSSLNEQLVAAAKEGNVADMERLVADGAEVNMRGVHPPLVWAAEKGSLEAVRWLLDAGAEVNGNDGKTFWTPLMSAAHVGKMDIILLMMEGGADTSIMCQGQTALDVAQKYKNPEAIEYFKNPVRPPPPADEVSFSYKLDNRVLQEIFSFPRKERVTLIRRSGGGAVEAVTRETFSDLSDRDALRKAFDEHRRRGGVTPEEDIFPETLGKIARLKP